MNDHTRARFEAVTKELKSTGGNLVEICKKHGMNPSYFYTLRSKRAKFKKKYTKRTPKFVDVPIQAAARDVVIVCNPGALKSVLEQWS